MKLANNGMTVIGQFYNYMLLNPKKGLKRYYFYKSNIQCIP